MDFVSAIAAIPGAQPVTTKLNAYTFGPPKLVGAKDDLVAALSQLVRNAAGEE
jgi:hypothetical protein